MALQAVEKHLLVYRIVYLLYRDRENLSSKNVLIISPNKLFTEYISHLLPELGEENVTTKNIITIFNENFEGVAYAKGKNSMIENILSGNTERYEECERKYGYEFFEKLERYLKDYNSLDKINKDLIVSKKVIPVNTLQQYYFQPNQSDIKKSIEVTTDRIISVYFYQKPNSAQKKLKEQILLFFYKKIFGDDIIAIYKDFLSKNGFSTDVIQDKCINFEDMPALVYLKCKFFGINKIILLNKFL